MFISWGYIVIIYFNTHSFVFSVSQDQSGLVKISYKQNQSGSVLNQTGSIDISHKQNQSGSLKITHKQNHSSSLHLFLTVLATLPQLWDLETMIDHL